MKIGTAVEARYAGRSKWRTGKIVRVNSNGTYSIKYSNGRKERAVKKSLIRLVKRGKNESSTSKKARKKEKTSSTENSSNSSISSAEEYEDFKVGTAIEARYGGKTKWYKGKISRVNSNGTYDILYSDGDKERGVKKHLIRRFGSESKAKPKASRQAVAFDIKF